MAVQQRRVSKARKGNRRSHHALVAVQTTKCKECGKTIHQHRVCKYCGYYDGKKVVSA